MGVEENRAKSAGGSESQLRELSSATYADRYESIASIGTGGTGEVRAVRDPVLGRRVAVKQLLERLQDDPQIVAEFVKEAQIAGQLDHPNIVPVHDLGDHAGRPFMVMKEVRGRTLRSVLEQNSGPRSSEDLKRYLEAVLRICDALSFAHSRGVIHRDVKPENVMLGAHGEVYLMDWGLALLTRAGAAADEASLTALERRHGTVELPGSDGRAPSDGVQGTPEYMAPEQMRGDPTEIDERTDVFGIGGVLFEILTGDVPNDRRRLFGPALAGAPIAIPRENALWSQLPPELVRITEKALAPDRVDRHQSVLALKADLERFLSGGGWFEARLFGAGECIVRQGDVGDAAYIIERGWCEVRRGAGPESAVLRKLGPGDVFGETAVLTRAARTASVFAVTDVALRVITAQSLNRELDHNPWLGAFVRSLAALFREADSRLSRPAE